MGNKWSNNHCSPLFLLLPSFCKTFCFPAPPFLPSVADGAICVQDCNVSLFCNSHSISHFAALFIHWRTKSSVVESCINIKLIIMSCFFFDKCGKECYFGLNKIIHFSKKTQFIPYFHHLHFFKIHSFFRLINVKTFVFHVFMFLFEKEKGKKEDVMWL